MVHGLRDLRDADKSIHAEVESPAHHANDHCELPKLISLRRSQWMLFEERHDAVRQVLEAPDIESVQVLSVVVVASVDADATALEELLHVLEDTHALGSLHHSEVRLDLPAQTTLAVAEDRNAEAAFTVDEADDPLLESRPFLLIARTRRIVTGHAPTLHRGSDTTGTAGCSGFPAYSQLHSTGSLPRGAAPGVAPGGLP